MTAQRKILVVDDDRMTRDLLRIMLERAQYEVILAEDGLSGVERVETEKPDLVIIDGLLPKLHGFLACKAIKELISPPKVIMFTGIYTKPAYKWEVKQKYGADDLLTKPAGPADLLACVEKHLAGLPPLNRLESPQQSASIERSSVISRLVASTAERLLDPAPPAGYSASWNPTTS